MITKFPLTMLLAVCTLRCLAQEERDVEAASLNMKQLPKSIRFVESFASENPYAEGASLRSRRANFERTSTIHRVWSSDVNLALNRIDPRNVEAVRSIKPEIVSFQQAISAFVSKEQMQALEKAFDQRIRRFTELQNDFAKYESQEIVADLKNRKIDANDIQRILNTRGIVEGEFSRELIEGEYVAYTRKQRESEQELTSAIEEILTPKQLDAFVQFVLVDRDLLAHPIVGLSLNLSESQRRQIEAALSQFDRYVREHRPSNEVLAKQQEEFQKKHPRENFVPEYRKDPQLRSLYLAPYAILTPSQFRKIASISLLMGSDESFTDFKARLSETDIGVLGSLVDAGIQGEQTK